MTSSEGNSWDAGVNPFLGWIYRQEKVSWLREGIYIFVLRVYSRGLTAAPDDKIDGSNVSFGVKKTCGHVSQYVNVELYCTDMYSPCTVLQEDLMCGAGPVWHGFIVL